MIQRIQMLQPGQRILIFVMIFGGGLFLIVALVAFLILFTVNSAERQVGVAVLDTVTVSEFAALPGDNAYPATVATAPDGRVYSGSYDTGVIWAISLDGEVTALPETEELIGSTAAITIAPDSTLFVLDRIDSDPRAAGGMIWRIAPDNTLTEFGTIDDVEGFVSAHDIALDGQGNVYVSDRGRREVWRFTPDGIGEPWWEAPADDERRNDIVPTGLAYDPTTDTMLITDIETDSLYRVSLTGDLVETIYRHPQDTGERPAFDGITVAPDGTIYVAAFRADQGNGVIRIIDGDLTYIADNFRGASDVAYYDERVYVTNFDSRSLVLPGVNPQLPFSIDVIDLNPDPTG